MNNFKTNKIKVPINNVLPNPWNPNSQTKEMFEKEVSSIKELGLLGSILVREKAGCYEILDGEHRWKACKELNYTEIQVENMGEIDDSQAKLLTVMLNNLRGKDDIEKRAKIYEQLSAGQLSLLPFSEEQIENEKRLFKFDFAQYDKQKEVSQKSKDLYIGLPVSQPIYDMWHECLDVCNYGKQDKEQMLEIMMKHYLELFDDRPKGEF